MLSFRGAYVNVQISVLYFESLPMCLGFRLGSKLKKVGEMLQGIVTDADSAVRFHLRVIHTPLLIILHPQCRARIPFRYWSSFSHQWSCVCCTRLQLAPTHGPNFPSPRPLSPIIGCQAILTPALP